MPHAPGSSSLLRRLFTAAGWVVEDIPSGWRARRSSGGTTVIAYLEGGPPAGFQRQFPSDAEDILVLFGRPPEPHDRDRIELTGARVVVPEEVPGTVVSLLHMGPSSPLGGLAPEEASLGQAAPSPSWTSPRPQGTTEPIAPSAPSQTGGSLPSAPQAPTPSTLPSTPNSAPAPPTPATPPAYPTPEGRPLLARKPLLIRSPEASPPALSQDPLPFPQVVFESDRIVRPRLHEEDIHQMATSRWRGGSPRLVLVPFYLFAYALPDDGESSSAPPRLVAVPTVGGWPQFWPPGEREIVAALPHPHRRASPRIGKEQARREALGAIAEQHARLEERAEKVHGMLVIENERRPLGSEEVRIGPPALVWVPHWVVEAWNGREVLDAVTGLPVQLPLDPSEVGE